ncbi:MAG: DNA-binding response regulator [Chitinophagia bacterium]|nr:DNA-binding response regulator [Chitinophagia bacterium]
MNWSETKIPKVMVVEDDLPLQLIISRSLEEQFSIKAFTDGKDALAALHQGIIPDMLICDLRTVGMGGLELLQHVKSSGFFSSIPVLILSGDESTQTRIKCFDAGADDYMVKPFNPKELEVRLKAILRRSGKIFQN